MFGRLDSVIFKETSVLAAALPKKADFLIVFSGVVLARTIGNQGLQAEVTSSLSSSRKRREYLFRRVFGRYLLTVAKGSFN